MTAADLKTAPLTETDQILASLATRIHILLATEQIIEDSSSNLDPLGIALEAAARIGARAERKHLEATVASIQMQAAIDARA